MFRLTHLDVTLAMIQILLIELRHQTLPHIFATALKNIMMTESMSNVRVAIILVRNVAVRVYHHVPTVVLQQPTIEL